MKHSFLLLFVLGLTSACEKARMSVDFGPDRSGFSRGKIECGQAFRAIGVWQDLNSDGQIQKEDPFLDVIVPFSGELSAVANYGYAGFSSHVTHGPQAEAFEAQHFFYEGSDGLHFFMNYDKEKVGSADNSINVEVAIRDNKKQDSVVLSDEAGEMLALDADPRTFYYQGLFEYKLQSDGAVLGPLLTDDFQVIVQYRDIGDLKTAKVYSAVGAAINLNSEQSLPKTFVFRRAMFDKCGPI